MAPLALLMLTATTLLGLSGLTLWFWHADRARTRRIHRLVATARQTQTETGKHGRGKSGNRASILAHSAGFDSAWVMLLPRAEALKAALLRTGRTITLRQYLGWVAGIGSAVAITIGVLTGYVFIAILLGTVAGWFVPRMTVKRMARKRTAAFVKQFPDAIDLIIRALRAGLPFTEAISTIANECPDPIGHEFRRALGALAISRSVDEALWEIERNIDSAELRFFIISITTQLQTGGNLGETLGKLADVLRQRAQMRLKVKAMSGEARASAFVLGSLPFIITLLMSFTNPSYIMPLFTDPRGWAMLGAGALMLAVGVGSMAKLIQFEV